MEVGRGRGFCRSAAAGGGLALVSGWLLLGAASSAEAQNKITNGDFQADTAGWDLLLGSSLLWTNLTDEGGCTNSGSALVPSVFATGVHRAAISQCIVVHDESNLFAQVRHQGYGTFTVRLDYSTTSNCSTGFLTVATSSQSQDPVNWKTLVVSGVPPAEANGVLVTLRAEDTAAHGMLADEVILSARWPILLDGFAGNDEGETAPCRWVASP